MRFQNIDVLVLCLLAKNSLYSLEVISEICFYKRCFKISSFSFEEPPPPNCLLMHILPLSGVLLSVTSSAEV